MVMEMGGMKNMDPEIAGWILEFLLRQPIPEIAAKKLLTNSYFPIADDNPRLKRTVVLRSIESQISDGTVSEATLESLEIVEELDRREGIKIADSMKDAYCAVAVECAVKYLGGSPQKRGQGRYLEAVERVWRGRIGKLEEEGKSELITEELRSRRDKIEAAVWDSGAVRSLLERNTRNEALGLVRDYLGEARAQIGPPFLELVARTERELKEKEQLGDTGGERAAAEPNVGLKEVPKKNAVGLKHISLNRRPRGRVRIGESEEKSGLSVGRYDSLPSPEVNKVQEALKASTMELQAVVKDPLPDALHLAETVIVEMARKILHQDGSDENLSRKALKMSNTSLGELISEMAKKVLNHECVVENQKGKELDAPNQPVNNQAVEPCQTDKVNAAIPSCSHQNNVPKPSLMERKSTACTYEWDSIDELADGTAKCKSRFHLDSPNRKPVSPLKKYEIAKYAKRRKKRKWSLEEEDALREGVQKFGRGNWKLILNSRRDIFTERTDVDLKDKWRNMTRF